jgi:hypothetical protein
MRRIVVMSAMLMLLLVIAGPASAVIHEMVAAYCSGGGHGAIDADGFLEPSGLLDGKNFAQPVLSNGVVEIVAGLPMVTDRQPAKYPAGSIAFALPDPVHPSTHCQAMTP